MSALAVQVDGAHVLPPRREPDGRLTVSTYECWLALGADQRRHPAYAALAARMMIVRVREVAE